MLGHAETVLDQVQEGRRVALGDEHVIWVGGPQGPNLDVLADPRVRHLGRVGPALVEAVVGVARDARPGCQAVHVPRVHRRDVEDIRKLRADPHGRVVLVRDGVDAQPSSQLRRLVSCVPIAHPQQHLRQHVGASPAQHPQGLVRGRLYPLQQQLAALAQGDVVAYSCEAVRLKRGAVSELHLF